MALSMTRVLSSNRLVLAPEELRITSQAEAVVAHDAHGYRELPALDNLADRRRNRFLPPTTLARAREKAIAESIAAPISRRCLAVQAGGMSDMARLRPALCRTMNTVYRVTAAHGAERVLPLGASTSATSEHTTVPAYRSLA